MPSQAPPSLKVGDRIQVDQDVATVRYIGPVDSTEGEWLGVEWDNGTRGKHSGEKDGKSYFTCRYPGSGSFLRYNPKRVHIGASLPIALKEKYLPSNPNALQDEYDAEKDKGHVQFGGNKSITVETVGFEKIERKQGNLKNLGVAGLKSMQISSAGSVQEIANTCPNLTDLDLSNNLIPTWDTVLDILAQLLRLRILWLNDMRLILPLDINFTMYSPFESLKILSLRNTRISCQDIRALSPLLVNLEELSVGCNKWTDVDIVSEDQPNFQNLKLIHLESNEIDSWEKIEKLSNLPSLEQINLTANRISSIAPCKANGFKNLQYLHLNDNMISGIQSIDALDTYSALDHVRCKDNPVFKDMDAYQANVQLVGRIASINRANGNTILPKDRADMERYYLKLCTKDAASEEEIVKLHPRYLQLCDKHGKPIADKPDANISSALKNRLLNIRLCQRSGGTQPLESVHSASDLPQIIKSADKRILGTMTIRSLQNIVQKLFHIHVSDQRLYLVQADKQAAGAVTVQEITDGLKELLYYNIENGDEIAII
ncbi:unnamed protein product [Umbelopsis ramanniana]